MQSDYFPFNSKVTNFTVLKLISKQAFSLKYRD